MTAVAKSQRTYLTLAETAEYLRISRDTVLLAIRSGALPAKKSAPSGAGKYLIRRAAADAWFEELPDA